jgi:hypothetical protein
MEDTQTTPVIHLDPPTNVTMFTGVPTGTFLMVSIVVGLARMQPWEDITPSVEPGSDG